MTRVFFRSAILWAVCWLGWHAGASAVRAEDAANKHDPKLVCAAAAERGQKERDEGRLLDARRQLLVCADDACPAIVRRSCAEWLGEIEPRIPSIVLRVVDASNRDLTRASVSVDGEPIALDGRAIALDPGQHHVEIKVERTPQPTAYDFLAVEGESGRLVRIELQEVSQNNARRTPPPRDNRFVIPDGAWILAGTGVLALGAFAYFGIAATNDRADLEHSCSPTCTAEQTRPGRDKALAADITLGVGLAAIAGSIAWAWLAQPKPESARVTASISPTPGGVFATLRAGL